MNSERTVLIARHCAPQIQPELRERVRPLFAKQEERVLGIESGAAARARFRAALGEIVRPDARETALVIAHGTVISLVVADANGLDGFSFWESLGMGDYLVLSTPELKLLEHVRLGALP